MMDGHGKSDSLIGPAKLPNKAATGAAEAVEERGLAKGKTLKRNRFRTQSRQSLSSALERIRQAASREGVRRYHSHFLLRHGVVT
jgi:RNA-directed DNA polymerase